MDPSSIRFIVITDNVRDGQSGLIERAAAAVRGGATCIQLRLKDVSARDLTALAHELVAVKRVGPLAGEATVVRALAPFAIATVAPRIGVDPAALAAPFDLVSLALSKGLGCPAGSLVAGPREDVAAVVVSALDDDRTIGHVYEVVTGDTEIAAALADRGNDR